MVLDYHSENDLPLIPSLVRREKNKHVASRFFVPLTKGDDRESPNLVIARNEVTKQSPTIVPKEIASSLACGSLLAMTVLVVCITINR